MSPETAPTSPSSSRRRPSPRSPGAALAAFVTAHRRDLLAAGALVLLALAFFSPALVDGGSFGAFDLAAGRMSALGAGLFSTVHSFHNADSISQMVSWNTLDWKLVHSGQLPLWNDYSVLGMPQLLNFESSAFSLPDLVSYLAPLPEAFLVAVIVKLVLAGTGTYLAARVLGCRPLAAFFGGATFMLSGPFANWVTWPLSDVFCWAGWILGLAVLAYRRPGHPWPVTGLALAVAFSFYGGFPEATILLSMVAVVGAAVLACGLVATRRQLHPAGLASAVAGAVLGSALAAPLLWPGLQVIAASHRRGLQGFTALPLRTTSLFLAQGYFGMPIGPTTSFALSKWNYFETVAYIGEAAVALAAVALLTRWRRPVVIALAAATVFALAASYQPHLLPSLQEVLDKIGPLRQVRLSRTRTVAAFTTSLLAAFGLEELLSGFGRARLRRAWLAAGAALAAAVSYLAVDSALAGLTGRAATARVDSLIWPVAMTLAVVVVGAVLATQGGESDRPATAWRTRAAVSRKARRGSAGIARDGGGWPPSATRLRLRAALLRLTSWHLSSERGRRWHRRIPLAAAAALCAGQVAQLFFAGVGIASYSNRFYPATPAETRLESLVGSSLLGLDTGLPDVIQRSSPVGFYPNVNIGYGIRLFAVHDPLVPAAYYSSWPGPATPPAAGPALFFPDVDSAALARRYGIGYILAASRVTVPPAGTLKVAVIEGETLYSVPGAARFSFAGPGTISAVRPTGNGSWSMVADTSERELLVLRVTAVPGWHLSVDGKPVALARYDGIMQSASIGPGHHEIELRYWPGRLTTGLWAAGAAALVLLGWWLGLDEPVARWARLVGLLPRDKSPRRRSGSAE